MTRWLRWTAGLAWWCGAVLPMVAMHAFWVNHISPMPPEEIQRIPVGWLITFAGIHGAYSLCAAHPALRPPYQSWLAATPWTPRDPLPFGPAHLTLLDWFLLACYSVPFVFLIGEKVIFGPVAALIGYSLAMSGLLLTLQPRKYAYLLLFSLGVLVLVLVVNPYVGFVVALLCYVSALFGLQANLELFPWEKPKPRKYIGSPMHYLTPYPEPDPFEYWERLVWPALVGWGVFVVVFCIWFNGKLDIQVAYTGTQFIVLLAILFASLCYLVAYLCGHGSLLGFLGRVVSGKLIIPAYDVVYVAPLLALVSALVLPTIFRWVQLHPIIGWPLYLAIPLFFLTCCGPNRIRWQLTAPMHLGESKMIIETKRNQLGKAAAR